MKTTSIPSFQTPLIIRTRFAAIALLLSCVFNVAFNWVDYQFMSSLADAPPATYQDMVKLKAENGWWTQMFNLYAFFTILAIVAVCLWFYRANDNLWLHFDDLEFKPSWAVGWFFVPVACFYIPLRVMREIFSRSLQLDRREIYDDPRILAWWLFYWLPTLFSIIIGFRAPQEESSQIYFLIENSWQGPVFALLLFVPAVLLFLIMRDVTRMQDTNLKQH